MKNSLFPLLALVACLGVQAQTTTPSVGSGAPTAGIQQSFIRTYFRNGFNNLVALPPLADVKKLGTQGLVQEFADASKNASNKYALCKPNASAPSLAGDADMVQFYPALYTYYTSVGSTNAGYPTTDTLACPALVSFPGNACQYQLFDKPYALFVYSSAVLGGATTFSLASPFYAKWIALGGITSAGPAVSVATAITANSGTAATLQTFDQAAVFNITSGNLSGRLVAVGPQIYQTYSANGGYAGFLGLPVADQQLQSNGHQRQTFENGSIDYDPVSGVASIRYPVQDVSLNPANQLKLNLGDIATVSATVVDPKGNILTDRSVVWTTSNGQVISLQPSGYSVTLKAIGGGTANIYATSEGKSSLALSVFVNAPCCGIGQGAPTAAITQAFQNEVAHAKLNLVVPTATVVRRLGKGYVQDFTDASGTAYLLTLADQAAMASFVGGQILPAYQILGGPAGTLGYPASDANAAGRQLFLNQAALAGNPVTLVAGPILTKWAALNYESGPAGLPISSSASVTSFQATLGIAQSFQTATLVSIQTGGATGRSLAAAGLVNAAYLQAGGTTGSLGFPTSDEYPSGGRQRQDFEGGYIDYAPGDTAAQVHVGKRTPSITATPSAVLAGTRVRLAVGGFASGATLKISVTGQPDFTVSAASGAYTWEALVPPTAKSGTITLRAVDTASASSADGSYAIKTVADMVVRVTKTAGDGQAGAPGALLPTPITLLVTDTSNRPIVGIPVQFTPSPGAQVVGSSPVTDSNGIASATIRLPQTPGVSLLSATAGKQVVTFSEQALSFQLPKFPKFAQPAQGNDAFLAAAAAVLRYYQNNGQLPTPNGFADLPTLASFLGSYCLPSSEGGQICDGFLTNPDTGERVANLWRLAAFVGGSLDVSIDPAFPPGTFGTAARDALAHGLPAILLVGSNSVVASGIGPDGTLAIADADPSDTRANLPFAAESSINASLRLIPRNPASAGFVVSGPADFILNAPGPSCFATATVGSIRFSYCDGTQTAYQLDSATSGNFRLTLTDLRNPGSQSNLAGAGATSFAIQQVGAQWTAAPQTPNFQTSGIVNAADFTPPLAPGGILTIFGTGLARTGTTTSIDIGGEPAAMVAQSPFQVSAIIPIDLSLGPIAVNLHSPFGDGTAPATLQSSAPAIFLLGDGRGAVVNQAGSINGTDAPAARGETLVIYCTGLGAVNRSGALSTAANPVTVSIQGMALKPAFAGQTPGFPGLYQVNVALPAILPPGLDLPLSLQQQSVASKPVPVSVQ